MHHVAGTSAWHQQGRSVRSPTQSNIHISFSDVTSHIVHPHSPPPFKVERIAKPNTVRHVRDNIETGGSRGAAGLMLILDRVDGFFHDVHVLCQRVLWRAPSTPTLINHSRNWCHPSAAMPFKRHRNAEPTLRSYGRVRPWRNWGAVFRRGSSRINLGAGGQTRRDGAESAFDRHGHSPEVGPS